MATKKESNIRITKVKRLLESVTIEWGVPRKDGGFNKMTLKSSDLPTPDFEASIEELKPFLIQLCEVEKLDDKLIKATGITLTYNDKKDSLSVAISGNKTYENSPGCLNLISSSKPTLNQTGEPTAIENILSDECVAVIDKVIKHAKSFVDGDRIQVEMLPEDE